MPRYTITGASIDDVVPLGARNIREMKNVGIIFADLSESQMHSLRDRGFSVLLVEQVQNPPNGHDGTSPQGVVAPVLPNPQGTMYWPNQLIAAAGIDLLGKYKGAGVNIAIIDTGINEEHETVEGKVIYSKNYTNDEMRDGFDHGTGVAHIILSVVPSAKLLNMKVMDTKGDGSTEEIIEAIDDCIDMLDNNPNIAPAIINISAGTEDTGNYNDPLRVACRAAISRGIWISAAAGNEGPDEGSIVSPACERYVFATGSIIDAPPYSVSHFSSRGPTEEGLVKPDAVFFGESIIVASSLGKDDYICKSGTSFSAPFSTGVAALYMEALALNNRQPAQRIPNFEGLVSPISAEQLLDGGLGRLCVKPASAPASASIAAKDNDYGYGILSGNLIAQSIDGVTMTPTTTTLSPASSLIGFAVMAGMMNIMKSVMAVRAI